MRIGILRVPGARAEEAVATAARALGPESYALWYEETVLPADTAALVLPGGGTADAPLPVAAPAVEAVRRFAAEGGPVLGLGDGFSLLCAAGALPGRALPPAAMPVESALHLRVEGKPTPFTAAIPAGRVLDLPSPLAQIRYEHDGADGLGGAGQVVLRFCDHAGGVRETANPLRSDCAIAGLCNAFGNVVGIAADAALLELPLGRQLCESLRIYLTRPLG